MLHNIKKLLEHNGYNIPEDILDFFKENRLILTEP